ncbi:MAG TPA: response regulator [Pyrinomonadaceae bacterium]|jgi:DNA-binding response OmpR family regulator
MCHILYVEDHDDTRELVELVLASANYKVNTDSTVAGALKRARRRKFDLYLLDSWLPDGSGINLCQKLREFDSITPILFYSAAAYELDRHSAMKSGAQGYLIKPVAIEQLCDEVARLLNLDGNMKFDGKN